MTRYGYATTVAIAHAEVCMMSLQYILYVGCLCVLHNSTANCERIVTTSYTCKTALQMECSVANNPRAPEGKSGDLSLDGLVTDPHSCPQEPLDCLRRASDRSPLLPSGALGLFATLHSICRAVLHVYEVVTIFYFSTHSNSHAAIYPS